MSKQTNLLLSKQHLHSAVLKPQGSKNFLKQVVPLCVSFILHQRVEFDGKNFQTATYDGIKFQAFKPKLQNATLIDVRSGINSAMKVLDKNYLRELYLILTNVNDSTIFYECYKFQFNYLRGEAFHIDISSTEKTLGESTNSLFNAIDSLNHHTKYKEDELDIKLAITYYEDIMPVDYIPEGFRSDDESAAELQKLIKAQPSDYLILGVLKSGHHVLKCRGKGEVFSMRDSTHSSMEEVNNDETTTLKVQNTPERELQYTPVENDLRYSPIPIDYELSPIITVEDDEDELDNYQKHETMSKYDDHCFSDSTVCLLYPNDEEVIDNFDDILLEGSLEDENDIPPSKRSPDITSITKKYVQPIPEFYSGICDRFRTSDHAVIQKHLKTQEHCKSFVEVANKQYKRINDEQNTAADRHAKKRKARNEAILKEKPQTEDSEKEGAADHKVITVEDDEDELDNYPKHEVQNDQKRELIGFEENETMSQNDDHCFSASTALLLYPNDEEVIDNFDDILLEGSLEDENDIPPSKRSPDITSITKKYVQPIPEFYSGICDRFRTSDHAVIQKHLKTQEHCKSFVEVANKQYKRINDEQNTAADRHAKKRKARNEAILKEKPQTEDSEKEGAADHKDGAPSNRSPDITTKKHVEPMPEFYSGICGRFRTSYHAVIQKHMKTEEHWKSFVKVTNKQYKHNNDGQNTAANRPKTEDSEKEGGEADPEDHKDGAPIHEDITDEFDDLLLEESLHVENNLPPSKPSPDITSITKKQPGICDYFSTSDHAVIQKHLKTEEHCKSFVEIANKQYKHINDKQNTAADRHAKNQKARNEAILKMKPITEDSEKEGAEADPADHKGRAPIEEGSLQIEDDNPIYTFIDDLIDLQHRTREFYCDACNCFMTSDRAVIQEHLKTEEHYNSFVNIAKKQYKRINDAENAAAGRAKNRTAGKYAVLKKKPKTDDSEKEDLQPAGYKEKGDVMYDDEEASEVSLYYFNLDEEVDCL